MQQPHSISLLPNAMGETPHAIQYKKIAVTAIKTSDWAAEISSETLESVECIIPVMVYKTRDGYSIIDGVKRFNTLKNSPQSEIDCGIITPDPDPLHALLFRIALNRNRTFTMSEKLYFITHLLPYREENFYQSASQNMAIPKAELQLLEQIVSCSAEIKKAVGDGILALQTAPIVEQFSADDRQSVLTLFSTFPFSRQTQKDLSDWLPELAFRQHSTISEILSSQEITAIVHHPRLNAPQIIATLHRTLYEMRYPTIVSAKKRWNTLATALNPESKALTMKPSEAFEKNRLEMKITVTSGTQAQSLFAKLSEVSATEWERLIYPSLSSTDFQQNQV